MKANPSLIYSPGCLPEGRHSQMSLQLRNGKYFLDAPALYLSYPTLGKAGLIFAAAGGRITILMEQVISNANIFLYLLGNLQT